MRCKNFVGESGSDGKLHLLQRKDKQFARNNIFCIFRIFTSQDQAFSTSEQHLREFSKKMIKARDPLGDPDVSHHFPGAGKLLLISFSNSRTTQSTKYTSQHITMNAYNIIYMMTPVHTTHALVPCAKSTHCKATSFPGSQTSKLRGRPMPISPSTLFIYDTR